MKRFSFLSKPWTLAALALALMLALPWAALASSVDASVVDVTAPFGSVTLAPGESGAITINMSVTGNQVGTATFDVYSDWTLSGGTFTGSNPQTFTVPPRAAQDPATTFSTLGTVTVAAGQADGTFTLAVSAFNITNSNQTGAKLSDGADSNYQVTVEAPPPPSDTTPPVVTPNVSGTLGNNDWYVSDVTVSWTVTDDESAISSTSGCDSTAITTDTAGTTLTCTATSAGGTSSESVTIKRDATAPTIIWNGSINNDDSFYFGFVPAAPTCTADDALSGPGACNVTGYGTTVGSHTLTATAYDVAGNSTVETRTYTVKAWEMSGFYQPVDMGTSVWNTVKGGSTVPLKFEVFAGSFEFTDPSVIVQPLQASKVSCTSGSEDSIEDLAPAGNTVLRYDFADGQFIYNWKTPKSPDTCYKVTVSSTSGSSLSANFKLK
jgi:hypothetical protein